MEPEFESYTSVQRSQQQSQRQQSQRQQLQQTGLGVEIRRIKLPVTSGKELLASNSYFQAFFPSISVTAAIGYDLQDSSVIDASVTVPIDNNGNLNGKATMLGTRTGEIYKDKYGNPLPAEDQQTPRQFLVEATFKNNMLHSDFIIYEYEDDDSLFTVQQVLFENGNIVVVLRIDIDQFTLEFNRFVYQWVGFPYLQYSDVKQIFESYPDLEPGSNWQVKIETASKLCDRTMINQQ
jgi:hypothetical protein